MPSEADRLLVELALKNHLIQPAEADAALAETTPARDAGAVLLAKGLVQQRHLDSLRKKVQKQLEDRASSATAPPPGQDPTTAETRDEETPPSSPSSGSDVTAITQDPNQPPPVSLDPRTSGIILFGQIAVSKNVLKDEDLQVALARQQELAALGVQRRIGEILVDKKLLSADIVQKVLAYQEKFIFGCPRCGARWNVQGTAAQGNLRCPNDQVALQPMSSLLSIGVQGSVAPRPSGGGAGGTPSLAQPRPASALQPSYSAASQSSSARHTPTDQDPAGLLGLTWKGYRIEKVLGRGGMGAVYLATQLSLNRKVALKVMLRGAQAKPEELARFVREARKALAQLSHPYILKVWDAELDQSGELAWFTMEFVKGKSFKEALSSGTFPMDKGARVVAKIARAMDYAHKKGIVHRDLKPQNVMLDEEDVPKVLDFGLAKTTEVNAMQQLTQMGAFLGTPSYMAPEQAGGDPALVDGRADVYALGAILYEVLTGRPPFRTSSPLQTIKKVLNEPPEPPTKVFPGTLASLEPACLKALAKDPAARQQTALELAEQIEAVVGPEPVAPPSPTTAADGAKDGKDGRTTKGLFGRLFGG